MPQHGVKNTGTQPDERVPVVALWSQLRPEASSHQHVLPLTAVCERSLVHASVSEPEAGAGSRGVSVQQQLPDRTHILPRALLGLHVKSVCLHVSAETLQQDVFITLHVRI